MIRATPAALKQGLLLACDEVVGSPQSLPGAIQLWSAATSRSRHSGVEVAEAVPNKEVAAD